MRVGDTVQLETSPGRIGDLPAFLLRRLAGQSVLNVGAAGGVTYYLPDRAGLWFHARLAEVAAEAVAADIDADGIAHAARHGHTILHADAEAHDFGRRFDAILMIDVIEHVGSPARAVGNLLAHLVPGGALYISTPNPAYLGDVARTLLWRRPSVYWDHQALMAPEHLQALCDRHGHRLSEVHFFSHVDRRSLRNRLVSGAIAAAGRVNRRLNSSWLGVVQAGA